MTSRSIEIRAAHKEEMTEFRRIANTVFANNEADPADESSAVVQADWTTCAFVNGKMATSVAAYPFRMRLNGATANAAGLTAVGTLPEYRRQGLLRRAIRQSFRDQRERGQSLAVLWASYGAIYQRFGYGPASNAVSYEFDPRWAGLHPGLEPEGAVSVTQDADEALPALESIYLQYSKPRNLLLHRSQPLWRFGVLMALEKKKRTQIALYRNAQGDMRGHLVYTTEGSDEPSPNQRLDVRDFIALDLDAHLGLWRHLLAHDLVRTVRMGPVAEDDPSPLLVEEPRRLGRTLGDGIYLRVVDVERALPLRPYGENGRLVLEVRGDELCDWNEGTFRLESDGGERRVDRCSETPDLTLSPRALAALISGHTSASGLARAGMVDARDDSVLRRADRLFATHYRPFCADGF